MMYAQQERRSGWGASLVLYNNTDYFLVESVAAGAAVAGAAASFC